ncbi:endolytic transglycosylase MltG [Guggenheimella bovis]
MSFEKTFTVERGDRLDQDLIPKLSHTYELSETDIKMLLSITQVPLSERSDYKKWEGVFIEGEYKDIPIQLLLMDQSMKYQKRILDYGEDALVLASIVEKEVLGSNQYKEVADVFLNRLKTNMKLQSCVTVEYALGFERLFLRGKDILIDSPYNTYKNQGLPPGMIAVASVDALEAVTSDIEHDELFFYYDYLRNRLFFFKDYKTFHKRALESLNELLARKIDVREHIDKGRLFRDGEFEHFE